MSALIGTLVAFIVAGLAVLGLVPHQQPQQLPQQSLRQESLPTNIVPSNTSEEPTISITNISGRTITVEYANLSTTDYGPTPPSTLDVQNEGLSKSTLQVPMDGSPSGTVRFTMPADARIGNYRITPVGRPRDIAQYVGTAEPGLIAYRGSEHITYATFFLSESGTITADNVSVSGMSKYTDPDFGFSFWYPIGWILVDTPVLSHNFEGGKVIKHLEFTDASTPYARRISIDEFYTSSSSITDYWRVGFIKHYFDDSRQQWMIHDHSDGDSIHPVDIKIHTMGGLPIFESYERSIVPLSTHSLLVVSGTVPNALLKALAKTIVATDPSVATPVSAAEQIKTIQAERDAYAGQ